MTTHPHAALIVTHDHADFDALGSQVAAKKLNPQATIALSPSVGREVHPYLAVHRNRFKGVPAADIEYDRVQKLVLVDVKSQSRLHHIAPLLERLRDAPHSIEVHIYDHHAVRSDDLAGQFEIIAQVGSTLTLLVEQIMKLQLGIDHVEATLFALGIHTDTGSLTYANSTARDARALAHLLERGAELSLMNRYLHTAFNLEQRGAMARILDEVQVYSLGGLRIGVAAVPFHGGGSGLDEVTTRALDSLGYHALFALYEMRPGKLQVVGRTRTPLINVGLALAEFGGGGHAAAGAAVVKDQDLATASSRLLARLRQHPPAAQCARDIMSSPVHTVAPDTPLSQVKNSLRQWQHTGACVLRDGQLVGVISERDLEKAERAQRAHVNVSGFMSQKVIAMAPEASLEQVLEQMEQRDIGRVPIVRDQGGGKSQLLGIVTRSDVLSALYKT